MSFTYSGDPTRSPKDEMRFLIADKVMESHLIEDEEILYILGRFPGLSLNGPCALACEIMASIWAKRQEISTSNYHQRSDNVYTKLMDRARRFRLNAITTDHFRVPAISVCKKQWQENDNDNVKAAFRAGLLDNPLAPQDPYEPLDQEDNYLMP